MDYKQSIIQKNFNKANNISRSSLLQYKEKQKCKRTHCVLTFHHSLRNSFNTIREHCASVEKKIQTVQHLSCASHGCLQTTKQCEKPVGAGRGV
jgi:hypothetical protein